MGFLIVGVASLLTGIVLAVMTFYGSSDCVDECHGYALPLVASIALAGLGVLAVVGGLSSVIRDRDRRRLVERDHELRDLRLWPPGD